MLRNIALSVVIMAVLSLCGTADGRVWHVHPDSAISSIQAGIDSGSSGDTVLVCPETYYENINFNGKNILLGSLFLTTGDTLHISSTVIDGDSLGSVVTFENGEDGAAVILGFTVQNGRADYGGGIHCFGNSSPTITNNSITDNTADHRGGGIYCANNSSPTVIGNTITGNTALVACGGGILCIYSSSPTITGNTITGNTTDSLGGGIECVVNSSPIITGNTIAGNTAAYAGGGISCLVNSSPTITGNTIIGNTAAYAGGGIVSGYESSPTITDNIITGNAVDSVGGGIAFRESSPTIIRNTITDNTAYRGGGVACDSSSLGTIDSCTISGNNGDGVYCAYASSPAIHYCNISSNTDYGVRNIDPSVTVDADSNWWGDPTGPYHPTTNPGGSGDSVSDCVKYDPWLFEPVTGIEETVLQVSHIQSILFQNCPNPFAGLTSIQWSLPKSCHTTLRIHNLAGQLVRTLVDEYQGAGNYTVYWDEKDNSGQRVVQGVYFYRLEAGDFTSTKKMILLR